MEFDEQPIIIYRCGVAACASGSDPEGPRSARGTGANAIGLETLLLLFSWEVGLELHPLKSEPLARFGSLR